MPTRRQFLRLAALVPLAFAAPARAQTPAIYTEGGIAVDGTDVVAYFTQGRPVPGDAQISHSWNGATWLFSSPQNRDSFATDPDRYAPQFGGYCAYAVSEGYTAATVPEAWRIVDGKLYLNFSKRVQRWWERDIPGRIARGNANWPSVLN